MSKNVQMSFQTILMHVVLVTVAVAVGLLVYKYIRSNENFYSNKKSRHRHLRHQSNHHTNNVVLVSTPSSPTPTKGHCYWPNLKKDEYMNTAPSRTCKYGYGDLIKYGTKKKIKKISECVEKDNIDVCFPCEKNDRQIKGNFSLNQWKKRWKDNCNNTDFKGNQPPKAALKVGIFAEPLAKTPHLCRGDKRDSEFAFCVGPRR